MDVIDTAAMPWGESLVRQREGGDKIAHKRLFEGDEGSPDNYMLVLAKETSDFFSPRHRHPWDQIRLSLEGSIPIARGMLVSAGEIAYFPESVPYGPQQGGTDRIVLLLQFGGASGRGFIGVDRLNAAREALAKVGTFEQGLYARDTGHGTKRQDAYEALWEHVTGAPLDYVEPAYKAPIVMRPNALRWESTAGAGVRERRIGDFPPRGLALRALKLDAGAVATLPPRGALRLLFVLEGEGEIDGRTLRVHCAARLQPGEPAELRSATGIELIELAVAPVKRRGAKAA